MFVQTGGIQIFCIRHKSGIQQTDQLLSFHLLSSTTDTYRPQVHTPMHTFLSVFRIYSPIYPSIFCGTGLPEQQAYAQTSHSLVTLSSSLWGTPRHSQARCGICNHSSILCLNSTLMWFKNYLSENTMCLSKKKKKTFTLQYVLSQRCSSGFCFIPCIISYIY